MASTTDAAIIETDMLRPNHHPVVLLNEEEQLRAASCAATGKSKARTAPPQVRVQVRKEGPQFREAEKLPGEKGQVELGRPSK